MSYSTVSVTADNSPMDLYVGLPTAAARNGAGLVFLHDQHGLAQFTFDGVARLVEEGFTVAAPDNFHHAPKDEEDLATRKASLDDRFIINDTKAAIDWLVGTARVDPARIGVIGFCQGGRMAFVSASADDRLRAAVVLYGGNLFVPRGDGPSPFDRLPTIGCPVMALTGGRDTNPSPQDMDRVSKALAAHDIAHDFRSFPEAGHAFANHTEPRYYNEGAARAAWPLAIDFLKAHLL